MMCYMTCFGKPRDSAQLVLCCIPGAQKNAWHLSFCRKLGYSYKEKGEFYPWEHSESGKERGRREGQTEKRYCMNRSRPTPEAQLSGARSRSEFREAHYCSELEN